MYFRGKPITKSHDIPVPFGIRMAITRGHGLPEFGIVQRRVLFVQSDLNQGVNHAGVCDGRGNCWASDGL